MLKKMIIVTIMLFVMCFTSLDAYAAAYSFGPITIVENSEVRIPCRVKSDDDASTIFINSGLNGNFGVSFAIYECGANLRVTNFISVYTNGTYYIDHNRNQVVEGKSYYLVFRLAEPRYTQQVVISGSWEP